jgi:hypothetical protein
VSDKLDRIDILRGIIDRVLDIVRVDGEDFFSVSESGVMSLGVWYSHWYSGGAYYICFNAWLNWGPTDGDNPNTWFVVSNSADSFRYPVNVHDSEYKELVSLVREWVGKCRAEQQRTKWKR